MYHINSEVDKPDIKGMKDTMTSLMNRGIRLRDCHKLLEYYTSLRDALKDDFKRKYGVDNPNSPKQIVSYIADLSSRVAPNSKNDIINICFDDQHNKWTTNAEALQSLANLGYTFAQDLLDYRHAKKYAESIDSITKFADSEGLIHPTVTLNKTNRISYSSPGLMTIPKKLLWHMIAPYTPGNILYSADIKNQEPSILINMTGAEELKYALQSDEGLYETMFVQCFQPVAIANVLIDTFMEDRRYTINEIKQLGTISPASYAAKKPMTDGVYYNNEKVVAIETVCIGSSKGVYPDLPKTIEVETELNHIYSVEVEWENCDKQVKRSADYSVTGKLKGLEVRISKAERKEFKTSYNAITYGQSCQGTEEYCKIIDGKRVYKYITGIDAIKHYRKQIHELAYSGATGIRTMFGTPIYAGEEDNYRRLERILLDIPIQGTGADILSLLIKRVSDYCAEKQIVDKIRVYYTRHDEIILEVDREWHDKAGDEAVETIIRDMLEHQINDWIPFKLEVSKTEAAELGVDLGDDED